MITLYGWSDIKLMFVLGSRGDKDVAEYLRVIYKNMFMCWWLLKLGNKYKEVHCIMVYIWNKFYSKILKTNHRKIGLFGR